MEQAQRTRRDLKVKQAKGTQVKLITTTILVLLPTLALAQPLPVPKPPGPGGSCAHG